MKMPKLPGGMGNMQDLMKQAQKMMEDAQRLEEELDAERVEATAGGGVVKATVSGKGELVALSIQPDAVDPDDVEMLQDLIVGAVREAQSNAEKLRAERTSALTGGLGGGLPF